jgi:hypothetical protein
MDRARHARAPLLGCGGKKLLAKNKINYLSDTLFYVRFSGDITTNINKVATYLV